MNEIILVLLGLINIGLASFVVYLHGKVIKLETIINLWTNEPKLNYDNRQSRRESSPPFNPNQKEQSTEETDKKRTLSANEFQSQSPLQKAKKRADEEMNKKLKDAGLLPQELITAEEDK